MAGQELTTKDYTEHLGSRGVILLVLRPSLPLSCVNTGWFPSENACSPALGLRLPRPGFSRAWWELLQGIVPVLEGASPCRRNPKGNSWKAERAKSLTKTHPVPVFSTPWSRPPRISLTDTDGLSLTQVSLTWTTVSFTDKTPTMWLRAFPKKNYLSPCEPTFKYSLYKAETSLTK